MSMTLRADGTHAGSGERPEWWRDDRGEQGGARRPPGRCPGGRAAHPAAVAAAGPRREGQGQDVRPACNCVQRSEH